MEARGNVDGERKTITALFADIKGLTDLIADLDLEDARAILDPTLKLMMDAVHRYEGYVAQSLGDGIFALFGAPMAHEDHPQRALVAIPRKRLIIFSLLGNKPCNGRRMRKRSLTSLMP
jgi:class 3 adenylate cyclase